MTNIKHLCGALVCAVGLVSCATSPVSDDAAMMAKKTSAPSIEVGRDYHSFANVDEARIEHVHLDLDVDFKRRQLRGEVALRVALQPGASKVVLDTRDLTIEEVLVYRGVTPEPLAFTLADADPNLGSALTITLPRTVSGNTRLVVRYATSPNASGLQWLTPEQTAGKNEPFLFSQSQAIHARSWMPIQDTPSVRMTYTATIRTPEHLLAVMSASNDPDTQRDGEYEFEMPQAIPAYLIALGVGDLTFQPMSERTGIYAEPSLVAAAAAEFEDTERMLEISEQLYGPYRWGRYDLLILPPSFPFGGMENPRLSFITPTVIAGDKSLVALIAHELAHSWSGNLVTNATWRDLWLNEGFTSFLTDRIMHQVYGERRAQMEYFLDVQSLEKDMKDMAAGDQILAVDLRGRDPDDVFSGVPYTKGQLFLTWLETRLGRERFDAFLRGYFDAFAFQSITTEQFMTYLETALLEKYPGVVSRERIEQWIFEPGLPSDRPQPYSNAFEVISGFTADWLAGRKTLAVAGNDDWSVHEWLYFLNNLPEDMPASRMAELDAAFDLTASRNNEIAHSWFLQAIRHDYAPAFVPMETYLVGIGRRKLIVPLYAALVTTDKGKRFAQRVYAKARPGYHPLAVGSVDAVVGKP
ncbi:MAG: M1 family metallopeptidase [Gammaproteobacteria bacterium]